MPLIWCSISAHGFGHAAQIAPVLNAIGRLVPDLKAVLRTTVPSWFFEERLDIAWELSPSEQDVGCVQRGPLLIDVGATWAEHRRFHADWEVKVESEARAMRTRTPALVLSCISPLAIEAGTHIRVPTIGLCSISWDRILEPFVASARDDHMKIIRQIKQAYALADLMIRPAPGIPMGAFRNIADVGPIVGPIMPDAPSLRAMLGAGPEDWIVLIAFGGVALDSLPFERLEELTGYQFIVSGPVPDGCKRVRTVASLPLPFRSLMASADLIMSKPGYSTIVEAVAQAKPMIYVRRYNFADESALVDYLLRYGQGIELSAERFAQGHWKDALDAARTQPLPREPAPSPTGAAEAAEFLASYLKD
jgi:hypothetical protein